MGEFARVASIDSLKAFRAAMIKFAEAADYALADAQAEMQRMLLWLEVEQLPFWQSQIRKRQEVVGRAKEALRGKRLFTDATGRRQTALDEEKALIAAQAALRDAEQKLVNTRRHLRVLQHEVQVCAASLQRLGQVAQDGVPTAAAQLDGIMQTLEQYVALAPPVAEMPLEVSAAQPAAGMAMAPADEPQATTPQPPPPPAQETTPQEATLPATIPPPQPTSPPGSHAAIDESHRSLPDAPRR
jgi:hypothetical protein